ncbi:Pre protein translocase subunit Sec66-domain-containing protein [Suillus subaureus]|uniref:Pre protein translocase subunit Sec66-domain-containing protein n=1 Tax=Suillus subaureus TaxID=48587 RepID=A0A9P7ENG2_9AGAM|nr:Pre protein translocase subunit Sec66-domain-containing protein [Suillus subaureus]KAG1827010.1 Pre protein translocase subunit Sec66-domain-containing protein [Suillus subaureus]
MASVLVPVLYVGIVVSSLLLFSHFYRKRSAGKLYEPYFSSHPERDVYVSLLQKTDPPAHEALLKAALVRRAMTDVSRVVRLREDKPALQNLLQKGSIGDDLWNSLLQAEKELEAEIMEVVAEANTFVEGWGTIIFQSAGEMIANEKMRTVYEETPASRELKEQKYGKVGAKIDLPLPQPVLMPGPPPPGHPAHAAALAAAAAGGAPNSAPGTPVKPSNNLMLPRATSTKAESVVSSDGESHDTPSSKSSKKKGKKRK